MHHRILPLSAALGIAAAAALAFTLSGVPAPADEPSYPLLCKGGGGMMVEFEKHEAGWAMEVSFRKSAFSASSGKVQPGECAWLDRPMNADEPSRLLMTLGGKWSLKRFEMAVPAKKLFSIEFSGDRAAEIDTLFQKFATAGADIFLHGFSPPGFKTPVILVTKIGP